ncbi:CCA tRNA nucleotidyltransferase [Oligoflexia bacterium]|nr:CCA tRNA nucleotidyltransferase [Oligoflexia bacterium]
MNNHQKAGIASCASLKSEATACSILKELACSPALQPIVHALGQAACLHIVGGTVRDVFLGVKNIDLDLSCVFPPEQSKQLLEKAGLKVVETGIKHGTLTIVIDQKHIELTTFRKPNPANENLYSNSIEEDLSGRDFTLNAIAYAVSTNELFDPFAGIEALASATLKCVGDALQRFSEDPLRLLRLVRFGPAAGRAVEEHTLSAANARASTISDVSPERVRDEIVKILLSPQAAAGFRALLEIGLLEHTIPELLAGVGFEQNEHHIQDVFEHILAIVENCPVDRTLRLAALFHDIEKPSSLVVDAEGRRHFYCHEQAGEKTCKQVMKRLKFSNDEIKEVSTLVRYHMRPLECGPAGVRRLIRDLGDELMTSWLEIKLADAPPLVDRAVIEERLNNFKHMVDEEKLRAQGPAYGKLAISGQDLIELGMQPGPALGEVLKQLEELVIEDPDKNEHATLLCYAKDYAKSSLA